MQAKAESDSQLNLFDSIPGTQLFEYKEYLELLKLELQKFGLTNNQSKVFIYLGKHGAKTAPEVCKALSMPRTETYHILSLLQNMGIVTVELVHPTKYTSLPMDKAIMILISQKRDHVKELESKENKILDAWEKIPNFMIQTKDSDTEKMQVMQKSATIYNKIEEMVRTGENITILGNEKDISRLYHSNVLDLLECSRCSYKLVVMPCEVCPHFISKANKNIKLYKGNQPSNNCFIIKDDKEILFFMKNATHPSKNLLAMWTDSGSMINAMNLLFDFVWDSSSPL